MRTSKIRKNRSGFTLMEVLIVVIILAILAALLLPKMLAQPENAYIAEANQMLGIMGRAQGNILGMASVAGGNTTAGLAITKCGGDIDCTTTATEWTALGVVPPALNKSKFNYECTKTPPVCIATRVGNGNKSITFNYVTGYYTACGSEYKMNGSNETQSETGCRNG